MENNSIVSVSMDSCAPTYLDVPNFYIEIFLQYTTNPLTFTMYSSMIKILKSHNKLYKYIIPYLILSVSGNGDQF